MGNGPAAYCIRHAVHYTTPHCPDCVREAPTPATSVPTGTVPRRVNLAGVKHDSEKDSRPELLPLEALTEVSKVLAFGARKYQDNNWRGGFKFTRVLGATFRHLFAWSTGQDKDPETGLSHLAHAACNVLFLLTFEVTKTGEDDRYKTA